MGDRISIAFRKGNETSPILFSHWRGMDLLEEAETYKKALQEEAKIEGGSYPLYRLEPYTVLVDFIRHITQGEKRITGDLYLAKDTSEGDNSDNGHHDIDLES